MPPCSEGGRGTHSGTREPECYLAVREAGAPTQAPGSQSATLQLGRQGAREPPCSEGGGHHGAMQKATMEPPESQGARELGSYHGATNATSVSPCS